MAFLDEMNEADKKIRGEGANNKNPRSKEIFEDASATREQTEE